MAGNAESFSHSLTKWKLISFRVDLSESTCKSAIKSTRCRISSHEDPLSSDLPLESRLESRWLVASHPVTTCKSTSKSTCKVYHVISSLWNWSWLSSRLWSRLRSRRLVASRSVTTCKSTWSWLPSRLLSCLWSRLRSRHEKFTALSVKLKMEVDYQVDYEVDYLVFYEVDLEVDMKS